MKDTDEEKNGASVLTRLTYTYDLPLEITGVIENFAGGINNNTVVVFSAIY